MHYNKRVKAIFLLKILKKNFVRSIKIFSPNKVSLVDTTILIIKNYPE